MTPSDLAAVVARTLRIEGPLPAQQLLAALGVSQPTLSRALATMAAELVVHGATRSRAYGVRRVIPGLPPTIPVYQLRDGRIVAWAELVAVAPRGFHVRGPPGVSGFHPDLPWFLHGVRPAGFLGRLAARQHPELSLPPDVRLWSGDHVLRWLHEWGLDTVGNFVVGEPALRRMQQTEGQDAVSADARAAEYPARAAAVMSAGVPGSSAAGEQPKFLTTRLDLLRRVPVLVKFSPPVTDAKDRRTADLLRCEQHALAVLTAHGCDAAAASTLDAGGRTFLELERFDRDASGRIGVVSLETVAAHEGVSLDRWTIAADELGAAIAETDRRRIHLLERFGELIGNTDMHVGNLSFYFDGERVSGLTPVYDMLPMRYAVRSGEMTTEPLTLPSPTPRYAEEWRLAWGMAMAFWEIVAADAAIDVPLREVAGTNLASLRERRRLVDRLG